MMLQYILIRIFFILLMTTTIVISQNNNDNQVALLTGDNPRKTNITCFCTEDEQCDANSMCHLTQAHQTCYESWTLEGADNAIRVTAGYDIFSSIKFFFYV